MDPSEAVPLYIGSQLLKCIAGAARKTTSGSGHIYGSIGMFRSVGIVNCGPAQQIQEIPKLKTTMIVESHWRRIKHDFLHRFKRPRVDLVVWVLTRRVIPDAMRRMDTLLDGGNRTAMASWRKDYKCHGQRDMARHGGPRRNNKGNPKHIRLTPQSRQRNMRNQRTAQLNPRRKWPWR